MPYERDDVSVSEAAQATVADDGVARVVGGREVGGIEIRESNNEGGWIFSTVSVEVKR